MAGWATRRHVVPPRRHPLSRVLYVQDTRLARTSSCVRGRYGGRGQTSVVRRPHRCHRPMSLLGEISSPEAIGSQRERRVDAKPFLTPEGFPLAHGRPFRAVLFRARNYAVAEASPVWKLPPRLIMGKYERICQGIVQAHEAELAELIQKRQRRGSILDQSGLRSWPIFAFARRWS